MSSRKLRSRSQSVDSRAGNVQGNLEKNSLTDFSKERGIMTGEIREPEIITSNPNLGNANDENSTINQNSNDQPDNISRNQLQDFLNNVMQIIRAESAKQTAALQEESKKQTALLKAESANLTAALESLRSEIKRENEKLAKSLNAKFEAAHDKIREDFEVRVNSEIIIVSERIDNVRKDNENELVKLSSTIDEVYASVSEKIDTDVTQTREAITQIKEYVDDKFRTVSGDMQQVRRNADEISKVNATLGEMQNNLASRNSNTPQSADSGNAIVRVTTTDQQAASASSVDTNTIPSTNGVNVSSNSSCHDITSVVSQTSTSGICTNVNISRTGSAKIFSHHFIGERNSSLQLSKLASFIQSLAVW